MLFGIVARRTSEGSVQRMSADVRPLLQNLLGDLLDAGVVVLRGVCNTEAWGSGGNREFV